MCVPLFAGTRSRLPARRDVPIMRKHELWREFSACLASFGCPSRSVDSKVSGGAIVIVERCLYIVDVGGGFVAVTERVTGSGSGGSSGAGSDRDNNGLSIQLCSGSERG
jgi:hypothetical protein